MNRDLAAVCAELGEQEIAVLVMLARRLRDGQRVYGRLDLAHDDRDFCAWRSEELADVLLYGAFEELRRVLRERGSA